MVEIGDFYIILRQICSKLSRNVILSSFRNLADNKFLKQAQGGNYSPSFRTCFGIARTRCFDYYLAAMKQSQGNNFGHFLCKMLYKSPDLAVICSRFLRRRPAV